MTERTVVPDCGMQCHMVCDALDVLLVSSMHIRHNCLKRLIICNVYIIMLSMLTFYFVEYKVGQIHNGLFMNGTSCGIAIQTIAPYIKGILRIDLFTFSMIWNEGIKWTTLTKSSHIEKRSALFWYNYSKGWHICRLACQEVGTLIKHYSYI